jgi:hypothetical protein
MKAKSTFIFFVLFLFIFNFTASATTFFDINDSPHQEAIIEMSNLGILDGIGNNLFAPNTELNRAAAAKVSAQLLGYSEDDAFEASTLNPQFNDIIGTQHEWALGWINLMAEEGILQGVGSNEYAPGTPLKIEHWATILIRILQHETDNMSWPDDYNQTALNLGLDKQLAYEGSAIINRGQMAQMTTTAIYDVLRPDGEKIINLVDFHVEDSENVNDITIYDNAQLSLQLDSSVVPTGGNQVIQITATATYGPNNLPATNTRIEFFANAGNQVRHSQLSAREGLTNQNGQVTVNYLTLAEDDEQVLLIKANIQTDGNWVDTDIYAMASNTAASISGRITNPFDGSILSNIEFGLSQVSGKYIPVPVDSNGYYNMAIPAGEYYFNYSINVSESVPYTGQFEGSHSSLSTRGDLRYSFQKNIVNGNSYAISSEMGILTGTSNLSPNSEIFITEKGTSNTVIAVINSEQRFLISIQPGTYEIGTRTGTILKNNVTINRNQITDVGGI